MKSLLMSAILVALVAVGAQHLDTAVDSSSPVQSAAFGLCTQMTPIPDSTCESPPYEYYGMDDPNGQGGSTVYDYCCTLGVHGECQHPLGQGNSSACEIFGCASEDCRYVSGRDYCCERP